MGPWGRLVVSGIPRHPYREGLAWAPAPHQCWLSGRWSSWAVPLRAQLTWGGRVPLLPALSTYTARLAQPWFRLRHTPSPAHPGELPGGLTLCCLSFTQAPKHTRTRQARPVLPPLPIWSLWNPQRGCLAPKDLIWCHGTIPHTGDAACMDLNVLACAHWQVGAGPGGQWDHSRV